MNPAHPLQGLDAPPWADLTHAYGTAEDVPDHLRALADGDEEAAGEALEELWGSILHQGSVYSATAAAAPFLARLAAAGCRGTDLLVMLGAMAESDDDCRAAVTAQLPLLLPLLESEDSAMRQAAVWAVGRTCAPAARAAVQHRCAVEREGSVRAELLIALVRVDPRSGAESTAAALRPTEPPELRLAAVLAGLEAGLPWTREQHDALLAVLPANDLMNDRFDDGQREPLAAVCEALLRRDTDTDRAAALSLVTAALEDDRDGVREEALWAAERVCMVSRSAPSVLLPLVAPALADPQLSTTALMLLDKVAEQLAEPFAAPLLTPLVQLAADSGDPGSERDDLADRALQVLVRAAPGRAAPLLAARLADRPRALSAAAGRPGITEAPGIPFSAELLAAVRELLGRTPERRPGEPLHMMTQRHNTPIHLALLLEQWGDLAAPALPELLAAIDRAPLVVPKVLAGLGLQGDARALAVDALRAAAANGPTATRLTAARALHRIDGDRAPLLAAVTAALESGDPHQVRAATGDADTLGSAVTPLLRAALSDQGQDPSRPMADADIDLADALWRIDGDADTAIRVLGPAFRAAEDMTHPWTGIRAARLTARLGPAARSLRPELERLLDLPVHAPAAVIGLVGTLSREELRDRLDPSALADRLLDAVGGIGKPEVVLEALEALGPGALPAHQLQRIAALAERDRRVVDSGVDTEIALQDERLRDRVRATVRALAVRP